jgi:putative intracellular protease/amidase
MPTLYLFITDTFADWEPGHVIAELRSGRYLRDPSRRYDVVLCGSTRDRITTMGGIPMIPEVLVTDIRPGDRDLLVLPGADTWLDPNKEPVMETVQELLEDGMVVAAICGATLALANAGLLDNRPHTSNDLTALKMFCPRYRGERYYRNEPAVTGDNLVTASGLAPVEFAHHVFRKLDAMSPAALEAWHGLFTTRRPEFFYSLMQSVSADRKAEK